jgi:alpha-glucosidase
MGDHLSGDAAVDEAAYEARSHEHRMDQEPWAFGKKYLVHAREAIRLRYRLLPYLYSSFWEHTRDGLPIIRPVGFDENEPLSDTTFYFGKNLLVSPVLKPGQRLSKTELPKNARWFALDMPHTAYEGGTTAVVRTTLSTVPVWVRAGTVLPWAPAVSSTREGYDTLKLLVFAADAPHECRLYEDDGEGHAHLDGAFRLSEWKLSPEGRSRWILERKITGHFRPRYTQIELAFIGFPEGGATVEVDGSTIASTTNGHQVVCRVPVDFGQAVISFSESGGPPTN